MPEGVVHRGDPETAGEVGSEDTLGIDAAAGCDQVAQPRVHGGKQLRPQAGVLGQVDAPTGGGDIAVEAVQEPRKRGRSDGEVEGQGPPLLGEGERPRRAGTEALQHRQKRRHAGRCDRLHCSDDDIAPLGWDGELVLHEAVRPVEQVPATHAVERVEEGGQGAQGLGRGGGAKPGLVQRSDREPVGESSRGRARDLEPGLPGDLATAHAQAVGDRTGGGMVAAVSTER